MSYLMLSSNMEGWVHCNSCAIQPNDGFKGGFFLTNCGHIFCQPCVGRCSKNQCQVCGSSPVRTLRLGDEMKPDIKEMFMDPCERMKSIYKSYEFQTNHAKHLTSMHKKRSGAIFRQVKAISSKNEELSGQLRAATQERDNLKQALDDIKSSAQPVRSHGEMIHQFQAKSNLEFEKKNEAPQTFSDMTINAFSTKTPAAFKCGNPKKAGEKDVIRNFPF